MYKSKWFFIKILLIIFIGLIPTKKVSCQNALTETERNYHLNVKQFNEFVDRFNYKTDFNGNVIDSGFSSKISREKYLGLLFNAEDVRLNQNSKSFNPHYSNLKDSFIYNVVTNDIIINKYSPKIIAEAKSLVSYNNTKYEISIFLNQEIVDNGVKWVILSVKANFLEVLKEDTVLLRFIPPTSNETNFISLKRVFEDRGFQQYYTYKDFNYDPLSSFLFALNSNIVKFQYVEEIKYHFLNIDGWSMLVREFNRNTENSGWLIDNILKSNNDFKDSLEKLLQ